MQEKLDYNHFFRVENFQEYQQIMTKNLAKFYAARILFRKATDLA
jgi:hypothetical protein